MGVTTAVWITTLALIVAAALTLHETRKISEALQRAQETASRTERLSIAILERLSHQSGAPQTSHNKADTRPQIRSCLCSYFVPAFFCQMARGKGQSRLTPNTLRLLKWDKQKISCANSPL